MANEFTIPELGENVSAGDVVRILVKPGDTLAKDQAVLELETDKATIEVPSNVAGTVKEIKVKAGDKVKVGQLVLTLDEGAAGKSNGADAKPEPKADAKTDAAPRPKEQPAGAAEEGGLSQKGAAEPKRADGAAERGAAERNEGIAEPPEGQATDAPRQKRGEVVDINRGARQAQAAPAAEVPPGPAPPAAPSVRRLARELGVEITRVSGSGEGGRISVEDLQAYVKEALANPPVATGASGVAAQPLPDFTKWGEVERKPMSNIRRKTAEHLGHAWQVIPHVTQHDRADITALEALRKQFGPQAEKAGGKLTMTAIALKIVAGALKKFPQFNSSLDPARNEIVFKKGIHIGVAADTERGLLVPVVRDVDSKGIIELAVELAKASEKARGGKLSLDEMQGGGFTITNLGGIGGTSFTPIVNWPEVAILGISRGAIEPVWDGNAFQPRLMLPLSLSYDHRAIDGADAARFVRWVAEAFETPFLMAL
jgi:pyruvate dehydrogenase E2 component (dihydrolipoamide acetyltransferase)